MKYTLIFIILFFIFTRSLLAQADYKDFIFEIKQLNGQVELDSIPNMQPGKKYWKCLIQDRYEFAPNSMPDKALFDQRRYRSCHYTSPMYDSVVEKVMIRPAYSFYQVNPKVKLPKKAQIIPPTWGVRVWRDSFLKQSGCYLAQVLNERMWDANESCHVFAILQTQPIAYKTYECFLKTPAILIQMKDNQWIRDTLNHTSPYLKETQVPARFVLKTRFIQRKKPRFTLLATSDSICKLDTTKMFRKDGGFTEWREHVSSSCFGPSRIDLLQKALRRRCYKVAVTNVFDPQTKQALKRFQKKNHLPVGNFDAETIHKLGLEHLFRIEPDLQYRVEMPATRFQYDPKDDLKDALQMSFMNTKDLKKLFVIQ